MCGIASAKLLEHVKLALRIKTEKFDEELKVLIEAALRDLGIAGGVVADDCDPIVKQAVATYCKMNFGLPEDYDRLKRSYDEQKAQLATNTGHTEWGE